MSLNEKVTAGERPMWWSCRRYWGMQPVVEADFASIAYCRKLGALMYSI